MTNGAGLWGASCSWFRYATHSDRPSAALEGLSTNDLALNTNMTLNERKFRPFVLEIHRITDAQRTLRPSHPRPRSDLTEFEKGPLDVYAMFQPVRKSSSSSPTSGTCLCIVGMTSMDANLTVGPPRIYLDIRRRWRLRVPRQDKGEARSPTTSVRRAQPEHTRDR